MAKGQIKLNDNLSEILEYNSPTTQIKASPARLSDFPNSVVPAHWHQELECIVVFSGSMNYHVNNNTYTLHAGDGIIVNTNRIHLCSSATTDSNKLSDTEDDNSSHDAEYAVLLLHPDTLRFNSRMEQKYINPLLFDNNSEVFFLQHDILWQQEACAIILEIYHAVIDRIPCFELVAQSKFFQLWSLLYQNTIAQNGYELEETDPMSPLKNMISYIQSNYQNKMTLNDIAEAGTMCQSKCCRLFRDALKQSPIEYLQNHRITRSIYLLEHTELTITEIALECGFHGASYFTETFRKINGITPKEYRKQGKG